MRHVDETALMDAILETRGHDAVRVAARMLRAGVTMRTVEGVCSEAMNSLGRGFRPQRVCIGDVVAADRIVSRVLDLEILARFEHEPEFVHLVRQLS